MGLILSVLYDSPNWAPILSRDAGATWEEMPVELDCDAAAICTNDRVFCITPMASDTSAVTDGNIIHYGILPAPGRWSALAWNPASSVFCALCSDSALGATSRNGRTWTAVTAPSGITWYDMICSGDVFYAIGKRVNSDSYQMVSSSPDGISWSTPVQVGGFPFKASLLDDGGSPLILDPLGEGAALYLPPPSWPEVGDGMYMMGTNIMCALGGGVLVAAGSYDSSLSWDEVSGLSGFQVYNIASFKAGDPPARPDIGYSSWNTFKWAMIYARGTFVHLNSIGVWRSVNQGVDWSFSLPAIYDAYSDERMIACYGDITSLVAKPDFWTDLVNSRQT